VTPRLWGWVGLLTVAVGYEAWGLLDSGQSDTISELTAVVFRTSTRAGAVAFLIAWVLFAAWYAPHVALNQGHWRRPPAVSSSKEH